MLNKITRLKAWLRNMEANIQEINSRLSDMEAGYKRDSEEKNAVFRECWSALDARNGLLQARVDNIEALLRQIINENRQNTISLSHIANNSVKALIRIADILMINANRELYIDLSKKLLVEVPEGLELIRVGQCDTDGGYVMADNFENVNIAISLGINDDVSWDMDMANRGIKVLQFDPTIESLPEDHQNFEWSKIGIFGGDRFRIMPREYNCKYSTLNEVLSKIDPDDNYLILKMDIEGFEYEVFLDSFDLLHKFDQIVVEFHFLNDPAYAKMATFIINKIYETHKLINIHPNNWGEEIVIDGEIICSVLELTFLRKDNRSFLRHNKFAEWKLNFPNNTGDKEIFIL